MHINKKKRAGLPHPRSLHAVLGITLPPELLEFVVINLERDLQAGIYLTMRLAYESENPIVRRMYRKSQHFFRTIDQLMTKGDAVSLGIARRMLAFPEPGEIRLGYAANSSRGNGVGDGHLSTYIFNVLLTSPPLRDALRDEPDTITMIPGVDMDRASDILATIVKEELIEFTQQQAQLLAFDPACMQPRDVHHCWLPTGTLGTITAIVPVDDNDNVFLLVPGEICRSGPAMTAAQFFRHFPPPDGEKSDGGATSKERAMKQSMQNPTQLATFAHDHMKDPSNFKPRKEYRRKKKKGRKPKSE